MVCDHCKSDKHARCMLDNHRTWCDCQHTPQRRAPLRPDPPRPMIGANGGAD